MQKNFIPDIVLSEELERARRELVRSLGQVPEENSLGEPNEIPNMFNVLISSIYTMEYSMIKSKIRQADITVSPDIKGISMLDFYRGKGVIDIGYKAATKRLSSLKKRLCAKTGR